MMRIEKTGTRKRTEKKGRRKWMRQKLVEKEGIHLETIMVTWKIHQRPGSKNYDEKVIFFLDI